MEAWAKMSDILKETFKNALFNENHHIINKISLKCAPRDTWSQVNISSVMLPDLVLTKIHDTLWCL